MERNYVGDQMVVCAAGNVDHDALVETAHNRFHDLKADGAPIPEKAHYVGGEQRLLSDHEQAHIVLGMSRSGAQRGPCNPQSGQRRVIAGLDRQPEQQLA